MLRAKHRQVRVVPLAAFPLSQENGARPEQDGEGQAKGHQHVLVLPNCWGGDPSPAGGTFAGTGDGGDPPRLPRAVLMYCCRLETHAGQGRKKWAAAA